MIGGSVTVADDETHTGTGLALAIFEAKKKAGEEQLTPLSEESTRASMPAGLSAAQQAERVSLAAKTRLGILRGWATDASALGPALVGYIAAHAEVSLAGVSATVSPQASVGRAPDPLEAGAPIQGPEAAVALPVTKGSGTKLAVI